MIRKHPQISKKIQLGIAIILLFLALYSIHFIIPERDGNAIYPFDYFIFSFRFVSLLFLGLVNYYYLQPKFLDSRKYWQYIICIVAILIILLLIPRAFHFAGALPHHESMRPPHRALPHSFIPKPALLGPMLSLFMYMVVLWISFFIYSIKTKERMERALAEQEVDFLKNQINPHFVFNALNNIYSLSITQSEKTSESILKLSEILRYIFYETEKKTIPLDTELNYIKNYVAFQQIRLPETMKVTLKILNESHTASIVPMLLINFIENAFKYGVSTTIPSQIDIDIHYDEPWLTLKTYNTIFEIHGAAANKIGNENTIKRLDYHYGENYSFDSREGNEIFSTCLKIKLT